MAKRTFVCLFIVVNDLQQLSLYQLDVKNVILMEICGKRLYGATSRFLVQGESFGLVYRLHKFLYDLNQSPKAWFENFNNIIQQFGMTQCETCHSFFYHHLSVICVYRAVKMGYNSRANPTHHRFEPGWV